MNDLQQSGTKLVVGLACLALAAGAISWWYQFGAKHRATQFWGSRAAPLIARPSQVEAYELTPSDLASEARENSSLQLDLGRPYVAAQVRDLSKTRGMVHLRHALMSDRNYDWSPTPDPAGIDWQWCLKFHNDKSQALVVLSADLTTIGLADTDADKIQTVSCRPMTESLQEYFVGLELPAASTPQ